MYPSCFEFWIGFYFYHTVLISNLYHILRDSDSINTSPALLLCSDAGAARTQSVWNCWPETSDWNSTLRRTAKLETNLKSHFFRIGIFLRFLTFTVKILLKFIVKFKMYFVQMIRLCVSCAKVVNLLSCPSFLIKEVNYFLC